MKTSIISMLAMSAVLTSCVYVSPGKNGENGSDGWSGFSNNEGTCKSQIKPTLVT
jgi:hypothetical protein